MSGWISENSTIVVALIGAAGLVLQHLLNRRSRTEEVGAADRDNLVKRMGEQLDRLENAQQQDRRRIDWLEDELWSERAHSHKQNRALGENVDWGPRMVRWAEGDQLRPYPEPPDWEAHREILEAPRPRRPPPVPDAT